MKLFYAATLKNLIAATVLLLVSGLARVSAQVETTSTDNTPALLMGFSGAVSNSDVVLSWSMEDQTNIQWFVIERSGNGNSFDSIGMVVGMNNVQESDYSYTDARVLDGGNYYRLRIVNRDGGIKYSKVFMLNKSEKVVTKMQVYPNPASAVVNYTLSSVASGLVTVEIFNMAGVVVMTHQQQLTAGINQQSLAISTLKSGNYFLKVINQEGGNQYVQPFVKLM